MEELKGLEDRVTQRLAELRPLVDEYRELEQVAERLGLSQEAAKARPASPRTARPARGSARATPARRRRGSRNGGRREQLMAVVNEQPGITVREVGTRLGVDPTSLYRIVHKLEADGELRKSGRELRPV